MPLNRLLVAYYKFQWENSQIEFKFLRVVELAISFPKIMIEVAIFKKWLSTLLILEETIENLGNAKRVKISSPNIKFEDRLGGVSQYLF